MSRPPWTLLIAGLVAAGCSVSSSADGTSFAVGSGGPDGSGESTGDDSTGAGDGDSATTGDGDGTSSGDGDGTSSGDGDGTSSGDGDGTSSGDGDGTSSGDGDGTSSGDGDGTSSGDGDGTSSGDGDGTSFGDGDGTSSGDGDGTSSGDGDGTSSGDGDGTSGDGDGTSGDGDGTSGDGDGTSGGDGTGGGPCPCAPGACCIQSVCQPSPITVMRDNLARSIADGGYDGTGPSMECITLNGMGCAGTITDIDVRVGIDHPWAGDLVVRVVSPAGTEVTVLAQPGATPPSTIGDESDLSAAYPIRFNDDATDDAELMGSAAGVDTICLDDGFCNYFPNPDGDVGVALSDFNGEPITGDWQVCVADNEFGNQGTLQMVEAFVTFQ